MKSFYNHDIVNLSLLPGVPNDSFSEAWSISSNGGVIVGTAGQRRDPGTNILAGSFHGFIERRFSLWWVRDVVDFDNASATSAVGCNDHQDVVGFFRDNLDQLHGFVRLNGQTASAFNVGADFPDVLLDPGIHNAVLGINNNRWVVGVYREGNGKDFGFVAEAKNPANFLPIDMTKFVAATRGVTRTRVNGINSNGDIVGCFVDDTKSHGFTAKVELRNKKFEFVTNPAELIPIFVDGVLSTDVVASGINDSGIIVGNDNFANDKLTPTKGFMLDNGAFAKIDVPTDPTDPALTLHKTLVNGIDSHGTVVGAYRTNQGNLLPTRHAYFGFFADAVVPFPILVKTLGGIFPSAPPPTPVAVPFPLWPIPISRTFETSQNAVLGLVINELASSVTEMESRQRLRKAALELVLHEVRKLMQEG